MASTINASTSSGIVQTADTSGVLQLQTANTTAVTVDASQKVSFANPIQGGSITSGTAVASTSGTSIDFTGIPSWAKRITVLFGGTSTNGVSQIQVQLGNGSFVTTGYTNYSAYITTSAVAGLSSTSGFVTQTPSASNNLTGSMVIYNISGNIWVANHTIGDPGATLVSVGGGGVTLSSALDRLRITTIAGTDTFDAGSINIMYEG